MKKFAFILLTVFLTQGCAEEPGGIIVMNEETIENFFEKDKESWNPAMHLNLLYDQPVANAELPPVPQGNARLYGTIESDGPYVFSGSQSPIKDRGGNFSGSVFGKLGPAGKSGNAWFYADFNPETGEITDARAYIYGFMGGVCDMRKKTDATFGQVSQSEFSLNINGYCLFPQLSGTAVGYGLLAQGQHISGLGQNYKVRYVINGSPTVQTIPENPRQSPEIFDAGHGKAWVN